ncbi:MAG: hypothetical protein IPK77_10550 [Cellvibrio sp.]|nr:hypothetical protein [Cellvibrio sp.]
MIYVNRDNLPAQLAQRAAGYLISDFLDGMKDCRDGKLHQMGMSDSYDAGYSSQYELEQIMSEVFSDRK